MPVFKLPRFDRHTYIAINNDVVPDAEIALASANPHAGFDLILIDN